jgi:hypothetical protein
MVKRLLLFSALYAGAILSPASASDSPVVLGLDGTLGRSSSLGLGARLAVGLGSVGSWEVVGHCVYFLPVLELDTETQYYEGNVNLTRSISLGEEAVRPFFGAGLNVTRETQTVSRQGEEQRTFDETRAALNLLVGMHIGSGMQGLFFETRAIIGRDTQMVVTAGIRI